MSLLTQSLLFLCILASGPLSAAGPPQFLDSTPTAGDQVAPGTFSSSAGLSARFSDDVPFSFGPFTYAQLFDQNNNLVFGSSSGSSSGLSATVKFTPFLALRLAGLYTFRALVSDTAGQHIHQDITFTVTDDTTPSVAGLELTNESSASNYTLSVNQAGPEGPFTAITGISATLTLPSSSTNTIDWDDSSLALYEVVGAIKTLVPMTRLTSGTPSDGRIKYKVDATIYSTGLYEIDATTESIEAGGLHHRGLPVGEGPWQFNTAACVACVRVLYANAPDTNRPAITGYQPLTLTAQGVPFAVAALGASQAALGLLPADAGYLPLVTATQRSSLRFFQSGVPLSTPVTWTYPLASPFLFHLYFDLSDLPWGLDAADLKVRAYNGSVWHTVVAAFNTMTAQDDQAQITPPSGSGADVCYTLAYDAAFTPPPTPSSTATTSGTVTASQTPTPSATCTVSLSPSATPTLTATPTMTATVLSPSPSPSNTPAFAPTDLSKPVLGPVPVRAGEPLCLHFDSPPVSSACRLYNMAGDRVLEADFGGDSSPCLQTARLAPGLYLAHIHVITPDQGRKTELQKIAIVP